ncbi:MAG: hypothetical protein Q4A01_01650 [Coriobacteriales bacterium]|nr:hypothetical protein [Coriobacteriales bacterium]
MSSGRKYRCEIIVPEDSPYRRIVQELTWKPFEPLPPKKNKENKRRANSGSHVKHQLLTADGSVMVGYFTGPRAFNLFVEVFGEGIYLNYREVFREGFELTRIYTIYEPKRHFNKTGHKMLLRASVYGGLSAKRKREIGGVMRALDYSYMRVLDGSGDLVDVQREAVYMLNAWGYSVDEGKHIIRWPEGFTFARDERKATLSKVARRKGVPPKVKKEIQQCLFEMRKSEREEYEREREEYERAHPPINWGNVFRAAKSRYEALGVDFRKSANALSLIRQQFGGRSTEKMEGIVRVRLQGRGQNTYKLGTREMDSKSLVRLACDGDQDAMIALADLLAYVGVRERTTSQGEDSTNKTANDGDVDLPEWVIPEKADILQWLDAAKDLDCNSPEGQVAHHIRTQIGKGQLNVLLFDDDLYDEIIEADLVGGTTIQIESFPFHTALVRLPTFAGVLGVVVFRWQDFKESANPIDDFTNAVYQGYGMAYLMRDGGVNLNPSADLIRAAEKLVIYLDCDNAHIETVYVDGGSPQRRIKPDVHGRSDMDTTYVRGADMVTGVQVVVERERQKRETAEPIITRRAHFRRGYYARRRIGKREDWHYEKRWIKPTFVHGSSAIVTERRVRRFVL